MPSATGEEAQKLRRSRPASFRLGFHGLAWLSGGEVGVRVSTVEAEGPVAAAAVAPGLLDHGRLPGLRRGQRRGGRRLTGGHSAQPRCPVSGLRRRGKGQPLG